MAFCNKCGTKLPDNSKFCTECGASTDIGAAMNAAAKAPDQAIPERSSSFGQSAVPQPLVPGTESGLGWILPVLLAVAAIIIVYLLMAPNGTNTGTQADGVGVTAGNQARTDAGSGDRRAVDDASAAATIASGNVRAGGTVSAAVLDAAFNSDPAGAAIRYAGPIRVSGVIASMVQPGSTPSLSMEGRTRLNFMIVNFPAGYREQLAPLSKGQFISVACDQVRELGGTTILSGCLLR